MLSIVTNYVNEALEELHHVRWPTRQQAIRLSIIVIIFCAITSMVFGIVDFGLSRIVKILLSLTF
ncbi:preprotein translocase subunit SecE [Patescibacteria group bacterium]|nr:preprotein translocase subunit SecE [Patescibacteria group bacterium]